MVSPCLTDEETEAQNEEGSGPGSERNRTAPSGPDRAALEFCLCYLLAVWQITRYLRF